ncbi:MAG: ErfK/YbiS/YcfS/YnhG family protein [Planctomycetaceae bacterium]|nr:ErfK/YbiS/YcfS/YnhG family protein [Planctomycetaceae bacterium]
MRWPSWANSLDWGRLDNAQRNIGLYALSEIWDASDRLKSPQNRLVWPFPAATHGRVAMSQNPSHHRSSKRRRASSGMMTNSILGLILVVGCVYAVWGIRPLRHAWMAIGFGRQANGPISAQIQTTDSAQDDAEVWAGQPSNSKVPPPPLPLAEINKAAGDDETERDPFLSRTRPRQNANIRRPSILNPNSTEAELDRRFELEAHNGTDANSNSVQTADFEEPANSQQQRRKSRPVKKIQISTDPGDEASQRTEPKEILQIGDENDPREKPTTAPNRGGVKAKPASAIPGAGGPLQLPEVQKLIDAGQDAEAYQLLATAYTQYASDRPRFQELLDKMAQRIYFTPQPQIQPPYEIQAGDQLRKIASKYHLSWQYLSRVNQVDARKIRPGKKLKVFQGPFSATVDLSQFELVVFLNGNYVKRYSVGIGKDNSSPIGEFMVKEKLENPTYYGPEGNVMSADDPKNPLGERWIDIGNSFGIHGTIEPDSIGKSESAGCIRMKNEDVAEVYDLLTVGSTVIIQR